MPVLHTYRSKEGHYILAGVQGRIVTYRLSSDGASFLKDNSITRLWKSSKGSFHAGRRSWCLIGRSYIKRNCWKTGSFVANIRNRRKSIR